MLIGNFTTNIGDKNRITLPRQLQRQLEGSLILTRGYEQSLLLVDRSRWEYLISEINTKPLLNMSVRDTKRFLIGGAFEIEPDKQGRFVIPDTLLDYSKIETQIAIVGVGEWLEIWSADRWEEKLHYLAQNSADIADRLSEKL